MVRKHETSQKQGAGATEITCQAGSIARMFPSCDDLFCVVAIIFGVPSPPHLYHLDFSDRRHGCVPILTPLFFVYLLRTHAISHSVIPTWTRQIVSISPQILPRSATPIPLHVPVFVCALLTPCPLSALSQVRPTSTLPYIPLALFCSLLPPLSPPLVSFFF
jgi:hypothetical protein